MLNNKLLEGIWDGWKFPVEAIKNFFNITLDLSPSSLSSSSFLFVTLPFCNTFSFCLVFPQQGQPTKVTLPWWRTSLGWRLPISLFHVSSVRKYALNQPGIIWNAETLCRWWRWKVGRISSVVCFHSQSFGE